MRGGQLSYRRRRRLVALAAACVTAGGVATAILTLPTGEKADRSPTPFRPNAQSPSAPPPRQTRLSSADQRRILSSISLFISSSVARHHPERSWPIVHPILREGLTKRQWSSGNIPVVPYPAAGVDLVKFDSVTGDTAMVEVLLEPARSAHLARKTFQIELRRLSQPPHRWAVSSWVPEGVSQSQMDLNKPQRPSVVAAAVHPTHLSVLWIFVPIGILLGGLILVPAGMFAREAFAFRRAEAKFRASPAEPGRPTPLGRLRRPRPPGSPG